MAPHRSAPLCFAPHRSARPRSAPHRLAEAPAAAKTPRAVLRVKNGAAKLAKPPAAAAAAGEAPGGAPGSGLFMERSQSRLSLSASFEALAIYFPCMNSFDEEDAGRGRGSGAGSGLGGGKEPKGAGEGLWGAEGTVPARPPLCWEQVARRLRSQGSGAGGGAGGCGVLVLALAQGEGWGCQWSPSVGSFCGPLRLPSHKERLPRGGPAAAVCLALGWPPVPIRYSACARRG